MIPYLVIFGAHFLCQAVYTACMWQEPLTLGRRALWLFVIWCIPIFGIGVAGARFSRPHRSKET